MKEKDKSTPTQKDKGRESGHEGMGSLGGEMSRVSGGGERKRGILGFLGVQSREKRLKIIQVTKWSKPYRGAIKDRDKSG